MRRHHRSDGSQDQPKSFQEGSEGTGGGSLNSPSGLEITGPQAPPSGSLDPPSPSHILIYERNRLADAPVHHPVTVSDWAEDYRTKLESDRQLVGSLAYSPDADRQVSGRKLRECGSWLTFRDYFRRESDRVRLESGHFCQQVNLCRFCTYRAGARKFVRLKDRLSRAIEENPRSRPMFVTLTQRTGPILPDQMSTMFAAIARMRKARTNWESGRCRMKTKPVLAHTYGGAFAFETKRGTGTGDWHFHCHGVLLIDRGAKYVPIAQQLRDEWSEVLGYRASTELLPFRTADDLHEVVKYTVKFDETLTIEDRWDAYVWLKGCKLLRGYGSLKGDYPDEITDDITEEEDYIRWLMLRERKSYRTVKKMLVNASENEYSTNMVPSGTFSENNGI